MLQIGITKEETRMTTTYKDGAIITAGELWERVQYNVSNEQFSFILDGKGAVVEYALANAEKFFDDGALILHYDGKVVSPYCRKVVTMQGRRQTIAVLLPDGAVLNISHFADHHENGVFTSYELCGSSKVMEIGVSLEEGVHAVEPCTIAFGACILTASSALDYVAENRTAYFSLTAQAPVHTVTVGGGSAEDARFLCDGFASYAQGCQAEIESVKFPNGLDETEKAMYHSTFFCALENYKVKGDYRAFMAGHHYLIPMRSYYRDSYFTVLPMYAGHTDKIKEQLLVLAKGISPDGTCPSAVKFDYTAWSGDHYDSPSFLAMMLYDYVTFTNDPSVLFLDAGGQRLFEKAVLAVDALSKHADHTGLLYKSGKYNKHDWADEVNRSGYVTYDEVLYARALDCTSRLYDILGKGDEARRYAAEFQRVKDAINALLWEERLGYYVNFKAPDYTETNLSIDTVFAVIFRIAPHERAARMMKQMEALLETRNNREQEAGDYGVMCAYPFYSRIDSAYRKSAQPYCYHNGANWPYLSAMYAYAKRMMNMEYRYALESWFTYNIEKGNFTPVEFFSPPHKDGSLLQAWSAASAFVLNEEISTGFFD